MNGINGILLDSLSIDRIINSYDVSFDGKRMATICGKICIIWSTINNNTKHKRFRIITQLNKHGTLYHKKDICLVRFAPDNKHIITFGHDLKIVIWSLKTRKPVQIYEPNKHSLLHKDIITDVCFDVATNTMYTCSSDGMVLKWITFGLLGKEPTLLLRKPTAIKAIDLIAFQMGYSQYSRIAVASVDGIVSFYDSNGIELGSIQPNAEWKRNPSKYNGISNAWLDSQQFHMGAINDVRISPDGRCVVSASMDSTCKIWNSVSLRQDNATLLQQSSSTYHNDRVPLNQNTYEDNNPKHMRVNFNGGLYHTLRHERACSHIQFTSNSRYVITASADCTIKIWHLETGKAVFQVNLPSPVSQLIVKKYPTSDSTIIGTLFCALQNRIVVFALQQHDSMSLQSYRMNNSSSQGMQVKRPIITLKTLKDSIARCEINGEYLWSLIQQFDNLIDINQFKNNLYKYNITDIHALRIISDALENSFQLFDVCNILATNDSQAEYLFPALKRGDPISSILMNLGLRSSSKDVENVFVHDNNIENNSNNNDNNNNNDSNNNDDDDDDDINSTFLTATHVDQPVKVTSTALVPINNSDTASSPTSSSSLSTIISSNLSSNNSSNNNLHSSTMIVKVPSIPLHIKQEGYHSAIPNNKSIKSARTVPRTGRLRSEKWSKAVAQTARKPNDKKDAFKNKAVKPVYTSLVANQVVPNPLNNSNQLTIYDDDESNKKDASSSTYIEKFDPATRPLPLANLLRKLGQIRAYGECISDNEDEDNDITDSNNIDKDSSLDNKHDFDSKSMSTFNGEEALMLGLDVQFDRQCILQPYLMTPPTEHTDYIAKRLQTLPSYTKVICNKNIKS